MESLASRPEAEVIRVLIAGEFPDLAQMLAQVESTIFRFEAHVVPSIAEAQEMLGQLAPELILLNSELTNVESFLEQIRFLPIGRIVISRMLSASEMVRLVRLGVQDFLFIPYRPDEVLECLQRTLMIARERRWAARMAEQLQRQLQKLSILYSVGQTLTASLHLDEILPSIVEAAIHLTQAEEGNVWLLNEHSDTLHLRFHRSRDAPPPSAASAYPSIVPVANSLLGRAVRTGRPILLGPGAHELDTGFLVRSLLYVPLQVRGRILGVWGVLNRSQEIAFSQSDVHFLVMLGDYAAVAIEKAQLFEAIQAEKSKLEAILQGIEEPVLVLDFQERLILTNRSAQQYFGIPPQAQGQPFRSVVHHPELLSLIDRWNLKNQVVRQEITLPNRQTFQASMTAVEGVGYVIVMQDITYLKDLDRIKSEFVSMVSHDVRTPLTTIRGYVSLLPRVGPLNPRQQEFVEKVERAMRTIADLLNNLLDLSRMESGYILSLEVCSLSEILNDTVQIIQPQAEAKQHTLILEIPPHLPPVRGDPRRLEQVFLNLLSNAVKYTPPGGRITLRAHEQENYIVIQVSDTGVGIPPSDLPHIFSKFYRVQREGDNTEGTGLGLAIVKSIVERHGGRVWAESEVGKGSTFTVLLPCRPAHPDIPSVARPRGSSTPNSNPESASKSASI
ncbi:MAG: ATP-binding protein [Anaerolineae bacterium]|nr:ATP-binding protein [Anaerolineae bacterium]